MTIRTTILAALAGSLLMSSAVPALAQDEDPYASQEAIEFFAVLEGDGRLSRFIELLKASEATWFLERDAEDDEEYTLFAPSDDAFAQVPQGVLDALVEEEDRVALSQILEHHLIPAQGLEAADLEDGQELEPAVGENLDVMVDGETVTVSEAEVIGTDLETNDGVVHVVDAVLVPALIVDALKYRGVWPEEN